MNLELELTRARIAISRGEKSRARAILSALLEKDTGCVDAHIMLASIAINKEQSIANLKQALQINPSHEDAQRCLSELCKPPISTNRSAPQIIRTSKPELAKCEICGANLKKGNLISHISRVHSDAKTLKSRLHPIDMSRSNPQKKQTKRRRPSLAELSKKYPTLDDRKWGSDALDYAISFNDTMGVAAVRASKQKRRSSKRR